MMVCQDRLGTHVRTRKRESKQSANLAGYDASHDFIWAINPQNPANNINGMEGITNSTVRAKVGPMLTSVAFVSVPSLVRQIIVCVPVEIHTNG